MELPLRYDIDDQAVEDADGACVLTLDGSDFTADFNDRHGREIVAACNAHGTLVEALEQISLNLCYCDAMDAQEGPCDSCKAKAALESVPAGTIARDHVPTLIRTLENVERRMVARTDLETNLPSDLQAILAVVRDGLAAAKGGAA